MYPSKGEKSGKLELIAEKRFPYNGELYKVIDFLNKVLKHHNIIFGISLDGDELIVSIYET
ncbi:YpmA family protein [Caldanaerobius polysaccharolyticus]|uniref:YpmA family protein n=1 Tax=Caldanaerobius polysaccharolyticus TaxID=44256 RepID=UPI00047C6AA4|nr:YpmA family protein [Caldanaerobius polysaccharolyticus]